MILKIGSIVSEGYPLVTLVPEDPDIRQHIQPNGLASLEDYRSFPGNPEMMTIKNTSSGSDLKK